MRIRTKIFTGYFILILIGFYFFTRWIIDDVRKNYLETVEESMVDSAYILAGLIASQVETDRIQVSTIKQAFKKIHQQQFAAQIYDVTKTKVNLNLYVTDKSGVVLYDSGNAGNVGNDFSNWNDVRRSLLGEYGARATRQNADDPKSTILYVAAPICHNEEIIGNVTVYKSVNFISLFIDNAKEKILKHAIIAGIIVFVLGFILSAWLIQPIHKLIDYARAIRDRKQSAFPHLGKGEIKELGEAFDEMREALEGKKYVETYVANLTHELKSPISAIKGALEFIEDNNLQPDRRRQLLKNLNFETSRMQEIVDRMLLLTSLENRTELTTHEAIDLNNLLQSLVDNIREAHPTYLFHLIQTSDPITLYGEYFLLYQAFENILRNAVDFSPPEKAIDIKLEKTAPDQVKVTITDQGNGIPDYAISKIFDKFYSLPRPDGGKKGTGLGLSIVREITKLHNGSIYINSALNEGTCVTFLFHL